MDGIPLDSSYTWTAARERGVTRRQIAEDGILLSRGLYLSKSAEPDTQTRCRAWATLLPADAAFGLKTATVLLGAATRCPPIIDVVLRPRRVLPQRSGIAVHVRTLADEDVVERSGLRVTSAAQTYLDMAAVLPPQELLALGDALMRSAVLDAAHLARRLARADRVRGVVRARAWAPHLTHQAASYPESVVRYRLLASELPEPEVQVPIHDRWGREVAHADLGYSQWKVALEYEGRQHAEHDQFGRDIDRYSLMAADGWLVLRFAGRHGSHHVVERTRRALLSRGWRTSHS